jgi:hypothetical protein
MNKLLLNFFNENKKSVIIFILSVIVLLFICYYIFYSSVVLNCRYIDGYFYDDNYTTSSKKNIKKGNGFFDEDLIIELYDNQKKVKVVNSKITYSNNKHIFPSKDIDGYLGSYKQTIFDKNLVKWESGFIVDNFNIATEEATEEFELNRLNGSLIRKIHIRNSFGNINSNYQCLKGKNQF